MRRCAGCAVAAAAVAVPAVAGVLAGRLALDAGRPAGNLELPPSEALTVVAAVGCTLACAWLAVLAALGALEALRTAARSAADASPCRPMPAPGAGGGGGGGGGSRLPGRRTITLVVTALVLAVLQIPNAWAVPAGPQLAAEAGRAGGGEDEEAARPRGDEPAPGTWASLTTRSDAPPSQDPDPAAADRETSGAGGPGTRAEPGAGPPPATPFVAPPSPPAPEDSALVTGSPSRPPSELGGSEHVVVTAGDSLWSIAARHLGPEATDADIARAWPAWWRANAATIGEDPDLLLPGQRLVPPA